MPPTCIRFEKSISTISIDDSLSVSKFLDGRNPKINGASHALSLVKSQAGRQTSTGSGNLSSPLPTSLYSNMNNTPFLLDERWERLCSHLQIVQNSNHTLCFFLVRENVLCVLGRIPTSGGATLRRNRTAETGKKRQSGKKWISSYWLIL